MKVYDKTYTAGDSNKIKAWQGLARMLKYYNCKRHNALSVQAVSCKIRRKMKTIYDEEGNKVGMFNPYKAEIVATNKEENDTRWCRILRTASGKFVLTNVSLWQGERDTYTLFSLDEVILFMKKWGYNEKRIQEEFPEYCEKETY